MRALNDLQKAREIGLGENAEVQSVANYHAAILLTRFGHYEHAYEILKEFALREQDSPSVIEAEVSISSTSTRSTAPPR